MTKRIRKQDDSSAVIKTKKADFKLNDPVFGQMTGYPAWPGIIKAIGRTITVFFFGTNNRCVRPSF